MLRPNLHKRVLFAFLALSLIPLAVLGIYAGHNLTVVESFLRENTTHALDTQAARALALRAEMVSVDVARFLRQVEADLHDLALLNPDPETYRRFASHHRGEIWYRGGTNAAPREVREEVALYSEVAFIGPDGRERVRIVGGRATSDLRDVSDPANTTYLSEDYFLRASRLAAGEVHVTHVTGWHVSRDEQLQGAATPEEAVEGDRYTGVVRFATALRDENAELQGVVVLSLDHRHLMEFTQHITPTDERYVVFPSYDSGNYAFMFDNEGWIITHPKYWDIRGLDRSGRLVPPYTAESPPEVVRRGLIPYNLLHAGFVHPNYPVVARRVLNGEGGVADVTNVGGSQKIMAYAPIFYDRGVYAQSGIFGGVTIGAEVRNFHQPALETSAIIRKEITRFMHQTWLLIAVTVIAICLAAYRLSHSITSPLLRLIEGTKEMARGNLATTVSVNTSDEVGELADSFNTMARELDHRRSRLVRSLEALRHSRREIMRERNFKSIIFENVETGILTLDQYGRVTSINAPACAILDIDEPAEERGLADVLCAWPELVEALSGAPAAEDDQRWSRYVRIERAGKPLTFRLALLPLNVPKNWGRILTVEDLTERVSMREQMARMERLVSLGRLSAGLAHEIRNPLTGISILLDEMHDRLLDRRSDQELLQRALQEIERLEGLVTELLSFSGSSRPQLHEGDLGVVLHDIFVLIEKQCERCGVRFEMNVARDLPAFAMDPAKLKQAFINLLTNALDAMPAGGTLTVTARSDGDQVRVVIRDTGEGIAADRIPLIFEPFYTSKGEGTGLGLAITHTIISDHGGRIEVKSQPGEGATFTLFFPLRAAESAGPAVHRPL